MGTMAFLPGSERRMEEPVMHMSIPIHPLNWIKSLAFHEDDHTCPWCGETFSVHFCESGPVFRTHPENETHETEKPEAR